MFSSCSADESSETGAQVVQLMRVKRRVLRLFTVQVMSMDRLVIFGDNFSKKKNSYSGYFPLVA